MDNREKLKNLLTGADREEYDDDAVRALLNRDPAAARGCNYYPLHCALNLGASATAVGLLCDACPELIRETDSMGCTALHTAGLCGAALGVVHLLYDKWPEAIKVKDSEGWTPLHRACGMGNCGPSLEVVKYLVDKRPETLAVKGSTGETPFMLACVSGIAFSEVAKFLIEKHENAIKEKDINGWFPLHAACESGSSLEVVTMLVNAFPKALESKTEDEGDTPLHLACSAISAAPLEAVKLLIERFPKALQIQNNVNQTPLECAKERNASPEIVDLLSALHSLTNLAENDPEITAILRRFHDMNWPGGVTLVLDAFPSVVNTFEHNIFPTILSMVGRRCSLSTFYSMLQDNPTLVKGAVKTDSRGAEEPPTKRIRK